MEGLCIELRTTIVDLTYPNHTKNILTRNTKAAFLVPASLQRHTIPRKNKSNQHSLSHTNQSLSAYNLIQSSNPHKKGWTVNLQYFSLDTQNYASTFAESPEAVAAGPSAALPLAPLDDSGPCDCCVDCCASSARISSPVRKRPPGPRGRRMACLWRDS